MLVLLGIAFLAGVITAISPCVLPVLPIVLAGGASGGRRRPFAIVAGPPDDVRRLDPLRLVRARQARAAAGPAAEPLDRAALRDRGDAARPADRAVDRARAGALQPPERQARRQRLPARLRARLRIRPLRRADPRVRLGAVGERELRLPADRARDRVRARRGRRALRDRGRRTAHRRSAAHARARAAQGARRRDRGGGRGARLQRRHEAADVAAGLDGLLPEPHGADGVRARQALRQEQVRRGADAGRDACPTTARRPRSPAAGAGSTPRR